MGLTVICISLNSYCTNMKILRKIVELDFMTEIDNYRRFTIQSRETENFIVAGT